MIRSTTTSEYATSCSTAFYWFMNCKLGCGWHVTRLMGFVAGAWLLRCFDEARDRVWGQATVVEMIGRNTQDSILSQTRISCSQDESAANSPNKTLRVPTLLTFIPVLCITCKYLYSSTATCTVHTTQDMRRCNVVQTLHYKKCIGGENITACHDVGLMVVQTRASLRSDAISTIKA